jgi:DNA-binding CsgD family transcriptional regulator
MARRTWEQYENYILQQWSLTRREVQVALECIKGKKNKEIASLLGIGAETVNKTLDNIYRAIGINGRDQLVAKLLIADIENTPLQQALSLTGEGSTLVGAGFLATLYASRSERKRPRSLQLALTTSNGDAYRSKPVRLALSPGDIESQKRVAAAAASASVTSSCLSDAEKAPQSSAENLGWVISPESQLETTRVDG